MVTYDEQRMKEIVDRLVATGNSLRVFTVPMMAIFMGVVLSLIFTLIAAWLWWVGAILGIAFGAVLGRLASSFLAAILEWMAQILIALGELISQGKDREQS
jgi:small-conductance mechanosensitive channel